MQLVSWHFKTPEGFTLRGSFSPASGKPVLHVLHGNGYCSKMYWPLLTELAPYFDLFLSDAQGHGDSDHGGPFVGWNRSAELAHLAFSAHKSEFGDAPIVGLGHSFGGVLTALMQAEQPDLFSETVLLDPVLFTPNMLKGMQLLDWIGWYPRNPMAKKAHKRRTHWPDKTHCHQYLYERGMFKGWSAPSLSAYIDHALSHDEQGSRLKCQSSREAEIFGSFPSKLWAKLNHNTGDKLLIYGNESYPFVSKSARYWQKHQPNLQVHKVTGGHCFMQQFPNETAQLLITHWRQRGIICS
jgi:pimeloyl-ACP methyl ester carboxylesterase